MTRDTLERLAGGPVSIKLVMPQNCGSMPVWEACLPTWPTFPPVRFRAWDDGGDGLYEPACDALLKWQRDEKEKS